MTRPLRILIVEDEWLVAEDHAQTLRDCGYSVIGPCATVESALDTINQETIDAALLDVELRNEKSFAVAEALIRLGVHFAFLSGHSKHDLPEALRGEVILSKPVAPNLLVRAIEDLMKTDVAR